jgi:hypothetical protein
MERKKDEWYYEGHFIFGYKFGIGRYFFPEGSYFYSRWEYDRKVGDILYNNLKGGSDDQPYWCTFNYYSEVTLEENYIRPEKFKEEEKKVNYII